MAWSRANAATWAGAVLGSLLLDAGITAEDSAGNLAEPIDEALMLTGVAAGDLAAATVADSDRYGFQRVLRSRVLRRIRDAVANRVSISTGDPNVSRQEQQMVEALNGLITAADAEAAVFVTAALLPSDWGVGVLSLDYLEPVVMP